MATMYQMKARLATKKLLLTHTNEHIQFIYDTQDIDYGDSEIDSESDHETKYPACKYINTDTFYNQYTCQAASLSAGGLIKLANLIIDPNHSITNGITILRPPGHHAEESTIMGFCLYNNVAVCANVLLHDPNNNINKILIIDWDVHHGNGTQNLFYANNQVIYYSIHRYQYGTFYAFTGNINEIGIDDGLGYNINVAIDDIGLGDLEYLKAFHQILIPIAKEYQPDLILISAGFDAGQGDPLGGMNVSNGYAMMTEQLLTITIMLF